MRLFLSGQGGFALAVAEAATDRGHTLAGIATPATRRNRADDGDPLNWDRVRAWAYPRRVPWVDADQLRAHHVPTDTDVILAAHSHAFIGRATRARAKVAAIGYHPSLLPLHRGRDAIRWTVRDRDKVTGGSVYHLTEHTDAGPLAAQEHILVPPNATARTLWREHLAPLGVRLILRVLDDLAAGHRVEVPQDEARATWEPSWSRPPLVKPELPQLPGTTAMHTHPDALYRD
ncbi:formyltransferase family protein [Actinokineospora cianjurensis]|uniref:Methionyl-tRNA formyltransferase n=1 Tax=Actinokineospora cianjurensis TaxID=585224 RepID=A0A421AYB6_9PSEU|nr:formyltransferase family protein [Actinokineospora cianjurensis]RLK54836.1 methionyl-tRNA formyltransferase [Actinokineospora cianjurensis]